MSAYKLVFEIRAAVSGALETPRSPPVTVPARWAVTPAGCRGKLPNRAPVKHEITFTSGCYSRTVSRGSPDPKPQPPSAQEEQGEVPREPGRWPRSRERPRALPVPVPSAHGRISFLAATFTGPGFCWRHLALSRGGGQSRPAAAESIARGRGCRPHPSPGAGTSPGCLPTLSTRSYRNLMNLSKSFQSTEVVNR